MGDVLPHAPNNCGWLHDEDLFARTFPMDLRPQGPEIIRTWTFSTMLRSLLEFDTLPWAAVSINGWILDPDRKKMSKSKGNIQRPAPLIDEFGADDYVELVKSRAYGDRDGAAVA